MRLGILLTTSPEHQNSITALRVTRAALELGHQVELFLMDDGVYNVVDSRDNPMSDEFSAIREQGATITLCGSNCDQRGVTKETAIPGLTFGSQYDHAQILHRAGRFLVFAWGMMKRVTMLVRQLPLNTLRASEALRVAVGYTLAPHRVTALLVDHGVLAASADLKPDVVGKREFAKHIETLKTLGHRVVADRPSYEALGRFPLRPEVELLGRAEVLKLLEDSDVVVPYWEFKVQGPTLAEVHWAVRTLDIEPWTLDGMRYLHIIKNPKEMWAWQVAETQAEVGHDVAILLWQDGIFSTREVSLPLYATAADLEARGVPAGRFKAMDYRDVVELIFQYERVSCWWWGVRWMVKAALLGLPVGLAFGYALQRGRFCMNTAFRDIFLIRDHTLLRAYVLAVLVQMLGVHLMAQQGWFPLGMAPFWWQAALVGGFVFGWGMALAGGWTTGISYRAGEGMVGSWISFVGFALGVLITNNGIFSPIQERLRAPRLETADGPATLARVLGASPWVVIAVLALLAGLWLWRGHQKTYQGGWSWFVTGVAIGVIGLIAWPLSSLTGRYFGLSVTEPAYSYMRFLGLGQVSALSWGSFMWIGIPFGAYVSARIHGEFKWRAPGPQRTLQALGGGVVMGIGAAIAGGCNVGHSLTGISTLSLTSITASLGILAGVWSAAVVLFRS